MRIKIFKRIKFSLVLCMLLFSTHAGFGQCECTPISGNLVLDGGFEITCGLTASFVSEMRLSCTNPWPIADWSNGVYNIGNGSIQSQWTGSPRTGNNYFVGDGLWGTNNISNRAWVQGGINVVSGNQYKFTAYYYEENSNTNSNQPAIALEVDGIAIATANANAGVNHQWNYICGTYTATTTGSVILAIRRFGLQTIGYANNDFGLDDISFEQIPSFSAVPQPDHQICYGASATFNGVATGGSGNYSYQWSNGATTQEITVSPTVSTLYTVTITDNVYGCVVEDNITVNVWDPLSLDLGSDVMVCITAPTNITAFPNGGSGSYSYLWNTGATTQGISVSNSNPGTYSVTVTDNNGCGSVIDNIYASQWTCQGTKYYQNTSSLPAYTAYDIIKAGRNVDPSIPPQGDVTVLNGQNVEFHGNSYVQLSPGFVTQPGAIFVADILPRCSFGTASIIESNVNHCTYKLTAFAENGSQNYSYLWNTGATTKEITVSPTSNTTYSVQITDNCLGSVANISHNLEVHYIGNFSYLFPNLVTRNGDGINDIWILGDNGKTEYAFNAYQYGLRIYNRWGSKVWESSGISSPNGTGFKEGDIYWNPSSPNNVSDGVYYASISFINCSQYAEVERKEWIQVTSGSYRMATVSDTTQNNLSFENNQDKLIAITPNPTSGKVNYYMNSFEEGDMTIVVLDSYGNEIFSKSEKITSGKENGELDLSKHPKGIYLIRFKSSKYSIVKKVLLE